MGVLGGRLAAQSWFCRRAGSLIPFPSLDGIVLIRRKLRNSSDQLKPRDAGIEDVTLVEPFEGLDLHLACVVEKCSNVVLG